MQFNNIKVKEKLNFYKVEFHNTYFNDCDFLEANNFFVMEMKAYKKELSIGKDKKSNINFWQEIIVFFINEKVSCFSQSWFLPFSWIFILNYSYFILQSLLNVDTKLLDISIILTTTILFWMIGRFLYESCKLYLAQYISIIIAFISVY